MRQHTLRAVFMRGGTSKALMFRQGDLPADRTQWDQIFRAALGSPDPNGRQLDGMGGGISSLSKICVIGPPTRPDADLDYTFAQVSVEDDTVDYSGNCGNMSSAVGPFAVDEGLVPLPRSVDAVVRIHNTNTNKIIVSRFAVEDGRAAVDGDLAVDGVAGTGAPVRLDFLDPGGSKTGRLLPTGNAADMIATPGFEPVRASLIDAANPAVFVPAEALGLSGTESPADIEGDSALQARLETLRREASVMMGLASDRDAAARIQAIPKIAMVASPARFTTLSGRVIERGDADILVRMISVGRPHRAVPLTGALCLAAACNVPGTVPHGFVAARDDIRIGHPSGVIKVAAEVARDGALTIRCASVYMTARRLFEGQVLYRSLGG